MAENVTVDAPKLNLPGNAERLIKCVRQGASRPSAALSLAISPALVFFSFFFFFIVSGGNPPLYRSVPVGSGEQIRLSRRDPPFPPLDGELPSARCEDVELSWRIQRFS